MRPFIFGEKGICLFMTAPDFPDFPEDPPTPCPAGVEFFEQAR